MLPTMILCSSILPIRKF